LTLAATMLAVSVGAPVPGRLARAFQRVLIWLGLQDVGAMELTTAAPMVSRRSDSLAAVRLLGFAAALAAACGSASTLLIFATRPLAAWMGRHLLWTPLAWTILKIAFQMIGMLPVAVGVSVAFEVSAIVRGRSVRDACAAAFRDWMWSLAAGLLIFGIAWLAGANLVGVVIVSAVAQLAAAGWLLTRKARPARSRRRERPIENRVGLRLGLSIGFSFAILSLICALQARMLTDVVGLGLGSWACWAALSAGLLAAMMKAADRKPRPPGPPQSAGAVMGAVAAAVLQSALGMMCLARAGALAAWVALFVLAQVPLVACATIVLSRQRRIFVASDGRPRAYLSCACAGAACGLLAYLVIGSAGLAATWLLGLATAMLAAAAVAGIATAKDVSGQVGWAVCGVALAGALVVATLVSIERAGEVTGNAAAGAWLTAVGGADSPMHPAGFLPVSRQRACRSAGVTNCAESLFFARRGVWWVVAGSASDLPAEMPGGVVAVASLPDGSIDTPGRAAGLASLAGFQRASAEVDFFRSAPLGGKMFDGIYLAPMPADHPQAWRCYNKDAIERCLSHLNPKDGVAAIRTQARAGRLYSALAAVATFHSVVGQSWVVMDLNNNRIDLMIAGPARKIRRPLPQQGVHVLLSDELLKLVGPIGPVCVPSPTRVSGGSVRGIEQLQRRLASGR
jgi:hypothetical protein